VEKTNPVKGKENVVVAQVNNKPGKVSPPSKQGTKKAGKTASKSKNNESGVKQSTLQTVKIQRNADLQQAIDAQNTKKRDFFPKQEKKEQLETKQSKIKKEVEDDFDTSTPSDEEQSHFSPKKKKNHKEANFGRPF